MISLGLRYVKPYHIIPLSGKDVYIVLKFIENNIRGITTFKFLLAEPFMLNFKKLHDLFSTVFQHQGTHTSAL
jgi:hypothetical protein